MAINLFDFSQNQGMSIDPKLKQQQPKVYNIQKNINQIPKTIQPTTKSSGFSLIPKAQASEWKMSIEEFGLMIKNKYPDYKDIDNTVLWQKMLEKYPDYNNIVDLSLSDQVSTQTKPTSVLSKIWTWLKWVKEWTENIIWWAIWQAPKIAWEVGGFLIWKPIDFALSKFWVNVPSLEAEFKKQGITNKKQLQDIIWVDEKAFTTQLWEYWAEVGTLFTPTWWAKVWAKITEKAPALVKWLKNLSIKAPWIYNTLKAWLVWAKEWAKVWVVSSWDVTTNDLVLWAGLWVWLQAWGKLLQKWKETLTKVLPENLVVSWLVNPSDLKNVSERISKLTWKELDVTDTSKWLLKNLEKWWNKENLRTQIQKVIENKKTQANNLLVNDTTKYSNDVTSSLKQALQEKLSNFWRFNKSWEFIASAWNQKSANEILELLNKKWLTLLDINKWRGIIWQNIFTKQWTQKDLQSLEWLQNVWRDTSKFIEETKPWFRALNKDVEVWIALWNAISKKEASDLTRQMLAYTWIWWTLWWVTSWWSPEEILKWALVWFWAWKLKEWLTSTTVKTKLAKLLNKFNKTEQEQIKNFIISNWDAEVSKDLLKKLRLALPLINNN